MPPIRSWIVSPETPPPSRLPEEWLEAVLRLAKLGEIAEKTKLPEAEDVVRLLLTLYTLRDRDDIEPDDVLGDAEEDSKAATGDAVDWQEVRQRVRELLSYTHSVGVTAKALDVRNEHERRFCEARVLTDVRPVFATNVRETPDAFILMHKLRIAYHQGRTIRSIYIAMDADDIQSLRDVLDRATAKEDTLGTLAEKSDVPVLRTRSSG
jgi:hypothetical protein